MIESSELISIYKPNLLKKKIETELLTIAISLVKNEGDIIAAWTSHICKLFDMVYIVDHSSIDGTREFLFEMAQKENNVHLIAFEHPGYFQAEITNHLAEIAARDYPNAWIFPLDADEFLSITSKAEFLSIIQKIETDRVLQLRWRNCVPLSLSADNEFTDISPCLIPPHQGTFKKLALHSSTYLNNNYQFMQGNHELQDGSGNLINRDVLIDFADLYHVPIRSYYHFSLKCMQGNLAYNALPNERKDAGQGSHWKIMMEKVLQDGVLSPAMIRGFIAHYGEPHLVNDSGVTIYSLIDSGWVCAPLNFPHLPLPKVSRLYKYINMAKQILEENHKPEFENFFRIVNKNNASTVFEQLGENLRCANSSKFISMPQVTHKDSEKIAEIKLLHQFISKAYTQHEMPVPSAWESHVPFLFCLLDFVRPRRFVELGTHFGNCFFAACQASLDMQSAIECIGIDTWEGDQHAGYYNNDVYKDFVYILNNNYYDVGKYIRKTFDEASFQFESGSIDLLHIDGLHTYEAVARDFETWLPKMSDCGLVMFHDTQERGNDFGVWKLWDEVKSIYPSFNFEHGHGLGILLVGNNPSPHVHSLFDILTQVDFANFMKFFFSHVGKLSPINKKAKV
ncbi:MAG: class I SAM-dependent methyltransferase [Chloroflexi bacterium]|nr:class I SAM-dependent methyltransferase [Chloroflexota bacterium]